MEKLFFCLLLILPVSAFAQDCDCTSSFQWTQQTFEENDAGFPLVVAQKGEAAYLKHNEKFLEKAKAITKQTDCYEMLREWLTFFRKGHFGIAPLQQNQGSSNSNFDDWEKVELDEASFKSYLTSNAVDDLEGIWESSPYLIGIKKIQGEYKGFIIEAKGSRWKKGHVKLVIHPDLSATYYMGDYSAQSIEKAELLGDQYLSLNNIYFKKVTPISSATNPEVDRYYTAITAGKPYLEKLNDQTLLLRIPSFEYSEKKHIDSVLSANEDIIKRTENLIIDLRNNGGGSDNSFKQLLPFLYTNPIETVGVELRSTPRNNQRVKNFISNPNMSESGKAWAKRSYKKLSENEGAFVNIEEAKTITTFESVYEYPKRIGIIVHEVNASTTEQFLLAARQSSKVKLFGQTTFGALDISYVYPAESPCGDFVLRYCLAKSLRIPEMTIDNIGIKPDYYIYNETPKYKWIDITKAMLEAK